jgi:hypothetical protein
MNYSYFFSWLVFLFLIGHKFRCPCNLAGLCKGDLTGKAETPLPNPPRRSKKVVRSAVLDAC